MDPDKQYLCKLDYKSSGDALWGGGGGGGGVDSCQGFGFNKSRSDVLCMHKIEVWWH